MNLQTCKFQLQVLDVCKTTEITPAVITPTSETTPSFLQKQMLTSSLQNNCSNSSQNLQKNLQVHFKRTSQCMFYLLTNFQRQNKIFAISVLMLRCQCRYFQMAVKSLPSVCTKKNVQLSPCVLLHLLDVPFTVANKTPNWLNQC